MLSQKTRYALKALLELAALPGGTLSCAQISAQRDIPMKFLETILAELKRHGLVHVQRGRNGGYRLAQRAEQISFGAVIRLMEGPLALLPCVSVTQFRRCADCADARTCELQQIFRVLRDNTVTVLDGWTLADALGKTGAPKARSRALAGKKASRTVSLKAPYLRKRSTG